MFGSLPDSSLGSWSFNLQVLGIVGALAVLVSVVGMHLVNAEMVLRAQRKPAGTVEPVVAARPAPAVQIQLAKVTLPPAPPKVTGREITEDQQRAFISDVADAPKRPLPVLVYEDDPEVRAYAEQIRIMLVLAGYDSGSAVLTNFAKAVSVPGVLLVVKDPARAPAFTGPLQNALKSVGIEALGAKDSDFKDGEAAVIVGHRKAN